MTVLKPAIKKTKSIFTAMLVLPAPVTLPGQTAPKPRYDDPVPLGFVRCSRLFQNCRQDISFPDAIPPIDSKLVLALNRNMVSLGRRSKPARIQGAVKRTLYFYFGLSKSSNAKEPHNRPPVG
ncbi:hypothetical protein LL912_05130 [Niabella sp. CC-SYL272]|uniref:hypothetical protein n=1 Tax=Niabella agricola TaxID=2891571 RepID=UPI001F27C20A|nr:hypothetical protein [Niabella agricola]MCF3108152.1 hypothetical protein [Niabella agricola]